MAVDLSAHVAEDGVAEAGRHVPNGCLASINAGTGLAPISAAECGSIILLLGISGNAPSSSPTGRTLPMSAEAVKVADNSADDGGAASSSVDV